MDGEKLVLSKTYTFGSRDIKDLTFGEITAREMGEVPLEPQKPKDFYPVICMLTGVTPAFLNTLCKADILKAVEHTAFLLGD